MTKDVEIAVEVLAETDRALLVFDGVIQVWIPKSQIKDQCEEQGLFGSKITSIFISEWLAGEKGLI
jgi:hypothetical protein